MLREQKRNTICSQVFEVHGVPTMPSDKQLQANQANATKSTGPRSQQGKARSRLNSWKHGLSAKTLIIVGEHPDDFSELRTHLMTELDPQSALESELVERLAAILWRLRRVPCFEAAILDVRYQQVWNQRDCTRVPETEEETKDRSDEKKELEEEQADWERSVELGLALTGGRYSDALGKLGRHEASLMNQFTRTLQTLRLLRQNQANNPKSVSKPKVEVLRLPPAA
jgi:hypothetical protein